MTALPDPDLPEPLARHVVELNAAIARGWVEPARVQAVIEALADLSPSMVSRVSSRMAIQGDVFSVARPALLKEAPNLDETTPWFDPERNRQRLAEQPELAYLLLFHVNGHLREAALNQINDALGSPFFLAAIAQRINDWVPVVRRSAVRCAERVFFTAPPAAVAEVAMFLMERTSHWRRGRDEALWLKRFFASPLVAEGVVDGIRTLQTSIAARTLRHALTGPGLDDRLLDLARNAASPAVRQIAFRTLIDGEACWRIGEDVEMGGWPPRVIRRLPRFERRPVARPISLDEAIALAAADRSAAIRRVAAEGLAKHRRAVEAPERLLSLLMQAPSPAILQRLEFVAQDLGLELPAASGSKGA
ncbi:hypothetical protein [Brevundimonas lenta]|uniref:Uncharacterized protein n=1 Tax=Brevundimonas lenta TaxID=424796 RepID=A0A7W6JBT4_9CAUL|nr:hypothetical protein [Brevundimonas lenta]MBB4082240.1 hypothetical protein [Brevundimonas lenta]